MEIEQPALGRIGTDTFSMTASWHWEGGWTLQVSSRLSGSQRWTQRVYEALSDDELLQALEDVGTQFLNLS